MAQRGKNFFALTNRWIPTLAQIAISHKTVARWKSTCGRICLLQQTLIRLEIILLMLKKTAETQWGDNDPNAGNWKKIQPRKFYSEIYQKNVENSFWLGEFPLDFLTIFCTKNATAIAGGLVWEENSHNFCIVDVDLQFFAIFYHPNSKNQFVGNAV